MSNDRKRQLMMITCEQASGARRQVERLRPLFIKSFLARQKLRNGKSTFSESSTQIYLSPFRACKLAHIADEGGAGSSLRVRRATRLKGWIYLRRPRQPSNPYFITYQRASCRRPVRMRSRAQPFQALTRQTRSTEQRLSIQASDLESLPGSKVHASLSLSV